MRRRVTISFMTNLRIGILVRPQPFEPHPRSHRPLGLAHAARALNLAVEPVWLATDGTHDFAACDALFASPGSPYRSLDGALRGIRYAP